jgi:hypothetical protein
MTEAEALHMKLTKIRGSAFADLFEGEPDFVFPAHQLRNGEDDPFLIDVFGYSMNVEGEDEVYAVVTNGMSDHRMAEGDDPEQPRRREIIQYFRQCTEAHAKRLRDMAWLPLHDGFLLDSHHTFQWEWPAVEGTPWKNALFLLPLWKTHREFAVEIEGEEVSFLWHIPISDAEWAYRKENGVDGLIDRMQEVELPWIFDEADREPMVE